MTDSMLDNYTVIDIETTGINRTNDSIIELSALKIRDNKVVDEFSTLINPDKEINAFITGLTGITNDMVSDAPKINDVLHDYIDFIADDVILGHNVNFDLSFIKNNLKKCYQEEMNNSHIDTLRLSRKNLKLENHKLSTIANHFGIDTKNNHRGLKDCYITYEVYNNIKKQISV